MKRTLCFEAEDCNDPLYNHIVEILRKYDPCFVSMGGGNGDWINLTFDIEEYTYVFDDNYGEYWSNTFFSEEEAIKDIKSWMQDKYDWYCRMYPNKNVTWTNKDCDNGIETEIYVPGTDEYARTRMKWRETV